MGVNITLKNSENALIALGSAAKCAGWANQLQAAGCTLSIQPKSLSVLHKGSNVASVQINTEALNLLIEGKLAPYSADTLAAKVADLYDKATKTLSDVGVLTYSKSHKEGNTVTVTAADAATDLNVPPPPIPASKSAKAGNVATVLSSKPKGSLASATGMHQPVPASSAGSVYHTVALGPNVNAAARIKLNGAAWSLSLRLEGTGLTAYKTQLKDADINMHKDGYASQHLSGDGGQQMALRALGAMLYATGIPFDALSSTPAALVNQGH